MYGTKESTETETAVETFVFDTLNVNAMIYYYTYNLNDVNSMDNLQQRRTKCIYSKTRI